MNDDIDAGDRRLLVAEWNADPRGDAFPMGGSVAEERARREVMRQRDAERNAARDAERKRRREMEIEQQAAERAERLAKFGPCRMCDEPAAGPKRHCTSCWSRKAKAGAVNRKRKVHPAALHEMPPAPMMPTVAATATSTPHPCTCGRPEPCTYLTHPPTPLARNGIALAVENLQAQTVGIMRGYSAEFRRAVEELLNQWEREQAVKQEESKS